MAEGEDATVGSHRPVAALPHEGEVVPAVETDDVVGRLHHHLGGVPSAGGRGRCRHGHRRARDREPAPGGVAEVHLADGAQVGPRQGHRRSPAGGARGDAHGGDGGTGVDRRHQVGQEGRGHRGTEARGQVVTGRGRIFGSPGNTRRIAGRGSEGLVVARGDVVERGRGQATGLVEGGIEQPDLSRRRRRFVGQCRHRGPQGSPHAGAADGLPRPRVGSAGAEGGVAGGRVAVGGHIGHLPARHRGQARAQGARRRPRIRVVGLGVAVLDSGSELPQGHRPRRRDPAAAGPLEDPRVPHRLPRRGAESTELGPPHPRHPWLAGGIVDLEGGVVGEARDVAVLGPLVTGGGHDRLSLGGGLLEEGRLHLDLRRPDHRLTLPPTGGQDLGGVLVHHGRIDVERTDTGVAAHVDVDVRPRDQAHHHLDVERRLPRPGTGIGARPVHTHTGDRRSGRDAVAGLEGPDVAGGVGLEFVEAHGDTLTLVGRVERRHRVRLGQVLGRRPRPLRRAARRRAGVGFDPRRRRRRGVRPPVDGADHLRRGHGQVVESDDALDDPRQRTGHRRRCGGFADDPTGRQPVLVEADPEGGGQPRRRPRHRDEKTVAGRGADGQALPLQPRTCGPDGAGRRPEPRRELPRRQEVPERRRPGGGHGLVERFQCGRVGRAEGDVDRQRARRRQRPEDPRPPGQTLGATGHLDHRRRHTGGGSRWRHQARGRGHGHGHHGYRHHSPSLTGLRTP